MLNADDVKLVYEMLKRSNAKKKKAKIVVDIRVFYSLYLIVFL